MEGSEHTDLCQLTGAINVKACTDDGFRSISKENHHSMCKALGPVSAIVFPVFLYSSQVWRVLYSCLTQLGHANQIKQISMLRP